MLLSEIYLKEQDNFYNVDITQQFNNDYLTPPNYLKNIGFILILDEEGMINDNLLDLMISYKLNNINLILEVPCDLIVHNKIQPKYLIQLASNVDFTISILPPKHPLISTEITFEQYQNVISEFTDQILLKNNFDKHIVPITNYLQYLMMSQILDFETLKNFNPEDEYIINHFIQYIPENESDKFKYIIKNKIIAYYDGEENFKQTSNFIFEKLYNHSKKILKDHLITQKN